MKSARKLVLVTGGAKRVGAEIVRYFAERDFNILLHYQKSQDAAVALAEEVTTKHSVEVAIVSGDLSKKEDVKKIFEAHSPDIVINNAGVFEVNDFDKNIDANMRAPMLVAQEAIAKMLAEGKRGTILFVGDAYIGRGGVYGEHLVGYTMSKAWIPQVVLQFATVYGSRGIQVLGVLNGPIEPLPKASLETIKAFADEINLPKGELSPWISGKKVAETIYLFVQMSAVNGDCLRVDGARGREAAREH